MAKVAVRCTHCDKRYALAEERLGQSMKCPACQQTFVAAAEEAEAPAPVAAAPRQAAVAPGAASGAGSLFDDDDLLSSAASAPAVSRPAGGDGAKKKGKRSAPQSHETEIRIYRKNGQVFADVPWAVLLKHPGIYLCGAGVLYSLLSLAMSLAQVGFLDPYGLIAAAVAGGLGYGMLTQSYYKTWSDFYEQKMTVSEAPEPTWLSSCMWSVVVSVALAGTMYLAFRFDPPRPALPATPAPAPAQGAPS